MGLANADGTGTGQTQTPLPPGPIRAGRLAPFAKPYPKETVNPCSSRAHQLHAWPAVCFPSEDLLTRRKTWAGPRRGTNG